MKKILATIFGAALVLSLVACAPSTNTTNQNSGGNDNDNTPPSAGTQTTDSTDSKTQGQGVDAVSTPSIATNLYTNLDKAAVFTAIQQYKGVCVVATVNADGTPNIAQFVPGALGDSHIMFGWAPSSSGTKDNFLRNGEAMMLYDVVNLAGETKEERHQGAKLIIVPETDETVIAKLTEDLPQESKERLASAVICKVVEVLPLG